ncbi:hypothetical protein Syun_024093 [Stephania yunnanensis]|uniref:Transmembrane protein n=1 Tax=Stephania yunnanensis TaxID=152371 RepID=A0AAP0FEE5_9MAGN
MSYMPPPAVFYPSTESTATQPQPTSHSNGSFTPVFVVLAVIVVLLGSSCCIGQVCARRVAKPKSSKNKQHEKQPKSKKQHEQPKAKKNKHNFDDGEDDIEFGFNNKRVPSAKASYHDTPLAMPTKEPRHPKNGGEAKREVRFAEHGGEPKACTWSEG